MGFPRSIFRKIVPTSIRKNIYRLLEFYVYKCGPYQEKFGKLRGLKVFYQINYQKKKLLAVKVPQSRTPIFLRSQTSDIDTFLEIFFAEEYAMDINISPALIIDGGANIGLSSVYFSNKYPEARILAVEPDLSNFEILKLNTSHYLNIMPIRAGIWHQRGRLKIANPTADSWGFQVEQTESEESSFEATTINDLLALANSNSIDILKLDIEGAEKEVLSYNKDWLARVKVLAIEVHDYIKPGCREALFSAIAPYDFAEHKKNPKEDVYVLATTKN